MDSASMCLKEIHNEFKINKVEGRYRQSQTGVPVCVCLGLLPTCTRTWRWTGQSDPGLHQVATSGADQVPNRIMSTVGSLQRWVSLHSYVKKANSIQSYSFLKKLRRWWSKRTSLTNRRLSMQLCPFFVHSLEKSRKYKPTSRTQELLGTTTRIR